MTDYIERWKKVRGKFPTEEENNFVDVIIEMAESLNDEVIKIPYIYDNDKYHKLIHIGDNKYRFVPAEEWMPIRVMYETYNTLIFGFDCDGMGRMRCIGDKVNDKIISKIEFVESSIYVYLDEEK